MRTVLTGLTFGESVRWHQDRVWFCDWVQGEVVAATPDGQREVMARVDTMPFCIDWLPSGDLLATAGGQARLLRQRDGALETYADLSAITTKPWNEVAVHASGNAYANSINFDFPGGEYRPGLIALVRPDGTAVTVAEDIAFPNGMVITGSTLIVAESYAARLTAFTIDPDGGLSDRRVWADLGEGAAPDGIGLDPNGDVWVADVPNQSCTLVREGGEVLRRVDTPLGCFSCAVGDGTLYMVVADYSDPAKMFSSQTGLLLAEDIG